MNILLLECYRDREFRKNLVNKILNEIKYKKAFVVDTKPVWDIKNSKYKNVEFIDYNDVVLGNYRNVNWLKIPPIDEDIRANHFDTESEFCWMADRITQADSHIFSKVKYFEIYKALLVNPYFKGNLEHSERVNLYLKHLRYWHYLINSNNINVIIYLDNAPHLGYDFVIYGISQKRPNTHFILDAYGPLVSYKIFSNNYKLPIPNNHKFFRIINDFKGNDSFTEPDFINEWERLTLPSKTEIRKEEAQIRFNEGIAKKNYWLKKFKKFKLRKEIFDIRWYYYHIKLKDYRYFEKVLFNFYESHTISEPFKNDKKYIYVPLHYQPEMNTSPMGGMYANQLLMIQKLSYYLPKDILLYVKDHPRQKMKYRDLQFYTDIINLDNTRLISRKEDTFKLIENSIAVATITGTAGWEGLFRGKPFLLFGFHVYQYFPGVMTIRSNNDCKKAIDKVVKGKIKITRNELKKYLLAYEKCSVKFDKENNLYRFTSVLIEEIKKYTI